MSQIHRAPVPCIGLPASCRPSPKVFLQLLCCSVYGCFYGCFLVIEAQGGTWFRTPCPNYQRSRTPLSAAAPGPRESITRPLSALVSAVYLSRVQGGCCVETMSQDPVLYTDGAGFNALIIEPVTIIKKSPRKTTVPFSGCCTADPKPFGPQAQPSVNFACPRELRRYNPLVMSS